MEWDELEWWKNGSIKTKQSSFLSVDIPWIYCLYRSLLHTHRWPITKTQQESSSCTLLGSIIPMAILTTIISGPDTRNRPLYVLFNPANYPSADDHLIMRGRIRRAFSCCASGAKMMAGRIRPSASLFHVCTFSLISRNYFSGIFVRNFGTIYRST
jgi:hypothetical protein